MFISSCKLKMLRDNKILKSIVVPSRFAQHAYESCPPPLV